MIPLVDFDPDAVYCGNVSACSIKIAVTIAGMYCLVMRGGDLVGAYMIIRVNPGYPVFIKTQLWNGQGNHLLAMPLRCIECCRLLYKFSEKMFDTLL